MKPSIPKKCKDTGINTWHCSKFKSLKQVLRLTKRHIPALAIELPKSRKYRQYAVFQCLIRGHQLVVTFCDGCMLGVIDQHGIPIRKSWRIASTFPIVALQDKTCDGNHMHGESRGQALKITESYMFSMTDAIHREFAKYAFSRTTQALPVSIRLPVAVSPGAIRGRSQSTALPSESPRTA